MKKLFLSTAALAIAATLPVSADNQQVVTINGQTATQSVKTIAFYDDNLVLTFADGTTQTVDMADVTIAFTFTDAIKALNTVKEKDAPVLFFDANGRQLKQAPKQGVYLMKKADKVVKVIKK